MWTAPSSNYFVSENSVRKETSLPVTEWDRLPDDLLRLILSRLPLSDAIRSSNVCRIWRSIIAEVQADEPDLPWVWSGESPDFYSLSDDRFYTLDLSSIGKRNCIGVYQDWMVLGSDEMENESASDVRSRIIYNPFSGVRIELPSMTGTAAHKIALTSPPDRDPNCLAAFVCRHNKNIGFCKVADKDAGWKRISYPEKFSDIVFFGGSLLAATVGGELKLVNTEFSSVASLFPAPPEQKLPHSIEYNFSHGPERAFVLKIRIYKLLVSDDELFMLCSFRMKALAVFKANFKLGKWEIAESLKGKAIFVYQSWFLSMRPIKSFGIEEDSVYSVNRSYAADTLNVIDKTLSYSYLTDATSDIWRTAFKYCRFYMLTPKLNLPAK